MKFIQRKYQNQIKPNLKHKDPGEIWERKITFIAIVYQAYCFKLERQSRDLKLLMILWESA